MANLAIKGHLTRGKEVIELLEMMGGAPQAASGSMESYCYYISEYASTKYKYISWDYIGPEEINKYNIFTLEEFLEKFPFKVGDVIKFPNNMAEKIAEMKWDEELEDIIYTSVSGCTRTCNVLKNIKNKTNMKDDCEKCGLQYGSVRCFDMDYCPNNKSKLNAVGLKDGKVIDCEVNKETNNDMYSSMFASLDMSKDCPKAPILSNRYDYAEGKCGYVIPDGYEFDCIKEGFQTEIILKPKKTKYPETYEECCKVLGISYRTQLSYTNPDVERGNTYLTKEKQLLDSFMKLRICRNAYWKIVGEEMGLGQPWEPDWTDGEQLKYSIYNLMNIIEKDCWCSSNVILAFLTAEMRDAFYENFKDLIEQCKELL